MSVKQCWDATVRRCERAKVRGCEGAEVRGCERARVRLKNIGALIVAPVAWTLLLGTPADAQTFGGSATGAEITVPTTGTTIRAATGTVPISGGGAEAALLVGDIPASATGGVA